MNSNNVYRQSLFKENLKVLDLCDLELNRLRLEQGKHFKASLEKMRMKPREERKTFAEWRGLFELLRIDVDDQIALLSQTELTKPLMKHMTSSSFDKSLKLAVRNEVFAGAVQVTDLMFSRDRLLEVMRKANERGLSHMVTRVEYSIFDVVVFEHEPCENQSQIESELKKAFDDFAKFKHGTIDPAGLEMPPSVKLSYFDTISKQFSSGLTMSQVIERHKKLLACTKPCAAAFTLTSLENLRGYKVTMHSSSPHHKTKDLKDRLAKYLFDLQAHIQQQSSATLALDDLAETRQAIQDYDTKVSLQWMLVLLESKERALLEVKESLRHRQTPLAWCQKMATFDRLGVRILVEESQLRSVEADSATKHVLVFDLDVFESRTPEWTWYLGHFTHLVLERSQNEHFFVCAHDHFRSEILKTQSLNNADEKVFIVTYKNGKWTKMPVSLPNNAQSTSHVTEPCEAESLPDAATAPALLPDSSPDDINILLLGETGVGKSTFINAYYNYLCFDSLDDALKKPELRGLITSTFVYIDSQDNVKRVKIGRNLEVSADDGVDPEKNEGLAAPGQSMTQHAKAYTFKRGGRTVRIIDTPGIGDCRGVAQDQKNFRETIEYLGKLSHLNAICILLKPNINCMELHRSNCIKELFSHLNKTSINNVIFCFTHTGRSNIRIGDTLPSLMQFIKSEIEAVSNVKVPLGAANIVCLDNEAFRFLALVKNLTEDEKRYFSEINEKTAFTHSWKLSKDASEKLIKYATSLPVLNIKDVVCYNQSRSMSVELVAKVIQALEQLCVNQRFTLAKEMVEAAADMTSCLRSKAVTLFNDHLDCHLEERVRACLSSVREGDSGLSQFLAQIRAYYQERLAAMRDAGSSDLDAKIQRLISFLDTDTAQQTVSQNH